MQLQIFISFLAYPGYNFSELLKLYIVKNLMNSIDIFKQYTLRDFQMLFQDYRKVHGGEKERKLMFWDKNKYLIHFFIIKLS